MDAFKTAYSRREQPQGLMFHSDRGSQYTAFAFRQLLDSLNVVQSFSKKGYPFDNACCESFFKYLKKEETNRRTYHSLEELKLSIFEYIDGFYNSRRPHGSIGMLTPNQKEDLYWNQADIWFQIDIIYKLCLLTWLWFSWASLIFGKHSIMSTLTILPHSWYFC